LMGGLLSKFETRATVVSCASVLSPGVRSTSSVVTVGACVIRPIEPGVIVIVADVALPIAKLGSWQVTTPAATEQLPPATVALANVVPGGNGSDRRTLVAAFGPRLDTVSV